MEGSRGIPLPGCHGDTQAVMLSMSSHKLILFYIWGSFPSVDIQKNPVRICLKIGISKKLKTQCLCIYSGSPAPLGGLLLPPDFCLKLSKVL